MKKIDMVLVEMAKIERLNEGHIFELCDEYGLSLIEEMQVLNMFYDTFGRNEIQLTPEDFEKPAMPIVNVETRFISLRHGFCK